MNEIFNAFPTLFSSPYFVIFAILIFIGLEMNHILNRPKRKKASATKKKIMRYLKSTFSRRAFSVAFLISLYFQHLNEDDYKNQPIYPIIKIIKAYIAAERNENSRSINQADSSSSENDNQTFSISTNSYNMPTNSSQNLCIKHHKKNVNPKLKQSDHQTSLDFGNYHLLFDAVYDDDDDHKNKYNFCIIKDNTPSNYTKTQ